MFFTGQVNQVLAFSIFQEFIIFQDLIFFSSQPDQVYALIII